MFKNFKNNFFKYYAVFLILFVLRYGGTFHNEWLGRKNEPAYNSTLNPKKLKDIRCSGEEPSLTTCTSFNVVDGNHDRDVALTCFENNVTVPFEHVGLSNRTDMDIQREATTGFLHVKYGGLIGAVCNDGWNDMSTSVALKSMNGATCRNKQKKPDGWRIMVRQIDCNGDESHLFFCKNSGWNYDSNCDEIVYCN